MPQVLGPRVVRCGHRSLRFRRVRRLIIIVDGHVLSFL